MQKLQTTQRASVNLKPAKFENRMKIKLTTAQRHALKGLVRNLKLVSLNIYATVTSTLKVSLKVNTVAVDYTLNRVLTFTI